MSREPSIKAVVFDLDGTLLNTSEHVLQAFEHVMREHGETQERQAIIEAIGPPLLECYQQLLPSHDPEKLAHRHHELQQSKEFLALVEEYVGMRQTLAVLRDAGIKTAVFTNRWRRGVNLLFQELGLGPEFDIVISPDELKCGKPHPEGLLLIASELSIPPHALAMVGDLPVDIKVGKNAGAGITIGITHGFGSREELEAAGADYIVDSLAELGKLIERLNDGKR
ncbi:HAD-IA family hydrolase [Candidatus Saccharibacteria bacterium]|nr:MAG: HAD-IA family hydrolase [Candidatus Saccharibacteria bacterium]